VLVQVVQVLLAHQEMMVLGPQVLMEQIQH
jgi:hypothetical protein